MALIRRQIFRASSTAGAAPAGTPPRTLTGTGSTPSSNTSARAPGSGSQRGRWEVISSAPAECSRDQEDNNYFFDVAAEDINSGETISVGPVCFAEGFGSCGACEDLEPECVNDDGCGEGELCQGGRCVRGPLAPGDNILSLTFDDAASVDQWLPVADAQAEDIVWAENAGTEGGACGDRREWERSDGLSSSNM